MTPKFIIIHTAAFKGEASIDEVRRWHLERDFLDVGYHYYIRRDGTIQKGRQETHVGAHCTDMDMNYRSLGICFEGHGDYEAFTQDQRNAMCDLYEDILTRWDIPVEDVLGHRETGAPKTCPGNKVDMDDIRNMLKLSMAFLPERRGDEIQPAKTDPPKWEMSMPAEWVQPVSYSNTLAEFKAGLRRRFERRNKAVFFFNFALSVLSKRLGVPELNMLKLTEIDMAEKKPWLERKLEEKSTYVGALVTVAVLVLGYFGYSVGVAELTTAVEAVVMAISALIVAGAGLYDIFRNEPDE